MPYLMIEDFAQGIDVRKSALTAQPGSLRKLENAIVTAGGEIEKRPMLSALGDLPPGETHGLAYKDTQLWVFGTTDPGSLGTLPDNVAYHRLTAPTLTINRVLDVQVFNSKFYVAARMSDDTLRHYYDGTEVADENAQGHSIYAHKSKLYSLDGENLRFSGVLDPTNWTDGTGSGIVDVTTQDADAADLVGVERYYDNLALFGRSSVQVWYLDPDPNNDTLVQTLGNIGLVSAQALARYGNGDVLFLSNTGIRSLRARDASNAAALNDVGAPVDGVVADLRAVLTADVAEGIKALVDPMSGRFWLIWGSKVLVLSTYPKSKVSAWSQFDLSYQIDYAVSASSRVALRSGETLLLYGASPQAGVNPFDPTSQTGLNVNNYDGTPVTLETPFMAAGNPAETKNWTGLDVSVTGTWDVYVNPTTNPANAWTRVATVNADTWDQGRIALGFHSTHIAVRLVSKGGDFASVSNLALHYSKGEAS